MRTAYLETLYELAQRDSQVYALISDNGAIVYDSFRAEFPGQYLNLGISEANMLGVAAGMASCGKIPFAYTIGAFLAYRAYEFIRNDICIQNQNVKLVGTGAGTVYSALGPTHHSTEDMGGLRALPNLILLCPASPLEVRKATRAAYEIEGPIYLRLGTNREREFYIEDYDFCVGKGIEIASGKDITIIGTGNILADVMDARKILGSEGISVRVVNIHTLSPFDKEIVEKAIDETRGILTVEDHNIIGGLGSAVAEVIAESGKGTLFRRLGLRNYSKGYGSWQQIKDKNQIGIMDICREARALLEVKSNGIY